MNENELKQFLIEKMFFDESMVNSLTRESKLTELGVDSLDFVDMIFQLEDHFDITIENAHNILTVGQLYDRIYEQLTLKTIQ